MSEPFLMEFPRMWLPSTPRCPSASVPRPNELHHRVQMPRLSFNLASEKNVGNWDEGERLCVNIISAQ